MYVSIPCILFGLGAKCLLSWILVVLQRSHICRSFLGVFGVSLAVADTSLTFAVGAVHLQADEFTSVLGLRMTRYHVCLLVQVLGRVYSALLWPVAVMAALDHLCTVTRTLSHGISRRFLLVAATIALWFLAAAYVFLLSGFRPEMEDVPHYEIRQCHVSHTPQTLQIAVLLFLVLACVGLHAWLSRSPALKDDTASSRGGVVDRAVCVFLDMWALFLVFLALPLVVPMGIPTYLDLNGGWLCFLNSLLITVVLCVACPAWQLEQGLAAVPPDSFCEWRAKFSTAAECKTQDEIHNSRRKSCSDQEGAHLYVKNSTFCQASSMTAANDCAPLNFSSDLTLLLPTEKL